MYFAAVAVGAIIGIILPMLATFGARGHAAAAVIMQMFAVIGGLASAGQLVIPLFFEAMFLGYFSSVSAKGSAAAITASNNTAVMLQELKERPPR